VRFPSISKDFQYFQTYAGAISEPPLAAPGSNLPEASAAADQKRHMDRYEWCGVEPGSEVKNIT
ncbi:hypothetical protein LI292_01960, partial [Blautia obeum]|uniref:hypothetical protein n=1 Tax=Blautia TaxID=572511 RepID=UPI001D0719C4